MEKTARFEGIIDGVSKKKDSTLSIKIGTQELLPDETAKIFDMGNKLVYVHIAESPLQEIEPPSMAQEFDGEKSPSERLRNVLYVLWDEKSKKDKPFEEYRKIQMEKIIQSIKDKLN